MTEVVAGLSSGVLVGFVLGLVGGGGSILAVPLLAHFVGVASPHVAIGTSAVGVAVNALSSLAVHAHKRAVKWRCAALFSIAGVVGAALGALIGRAVDGQRLLAWFGLLMLGVGASMLRPRRAAGRPEVRLTTSSAPVLAPRLVGLGLATGALSGFFGIGGGFLIVPALMLATDMPLPMAVGSSLVAVASFGITTAATYAAAGLVDWSLALLFITGGGVGGYLGTQAAARLATKQRSLTRVFAVIVLAVGLFVVGKGTGLLG